MGITETLIIYLVIGVVIALARGVAHQQARNTRALMEMGTWIVLWPFFAPALLGQAVSGAPAAAFGPHGATPIGYDASQRLLHAIESLEALTGWESKPSLVQLQAIMQSLAVARQRLQDIETLLQEREFDGMRVQAALADFRERGYDAHDARVDSLLARQRNIARLQTMRERTGEELERALLKIGEISSQVLLLRFSDHPEARLASLLTEVASHVEGLTAVMFDEV